MSSNEPPDRSKGATYEHENGIVDTVFYNDGERLLVVREYPTQEQFDGTVSDATYLGTNDLVEDLRDPVPDDANAGEGSPEENADGGDS
ncbi:MAG: hypothetical protein V5A46_01115 [Haloferacaceae archaeon]